MNIRRVTSVSDAAEFLSWLGERRPILAVDTETGGLEWWRQPLRTVQFGDGETAWVLSYNNWRSVIDQALREYDRPVAFWNRPFDCHMLEMHGLPQPDMHLTHDGVLMDSLVEPGLPHGLKPTADRVLGPGHSDSQKELKKAFHTYGWDWATVPEDFYLYWFYAGHDTILTARLAETLWPKVQPYLPAYYRDMAVQAILYRAERRGMRVDVDYTTGLLADWRGKITELAEQLLQFGIENPNADAQVVKALLDAGWEPTVFTAKTHKPSVAAEVLEGLDHPLAKLVVEHARLTKWCAAYLDNFLVERDANGKVHAGIRTAKALTGRMSVVQPPLQTLPRDDPTIRDCILADEGHSLYMVDYDGLQMRLFAHYAQEPALLEALRRGENLHLFVARAVYGDAAITKSDPRYTLAKNTQFGYVFGSGTENTAKTAGVPVQEAADFRSMYEEKFSGVRPFMQKVTQQGRERERIEGQPYIMTWGGRRIPTLDGRIYALVNYLIQGTEADLIKSKIIDVDAAGYGDWITMPVHDELIFNVPHGAEDEMPKVAEIMEELHAFDVPLTCETSGPYDRWGAKYRKAG